MSLFRPQKSLQKYRVFRDAKSSIEPEEIILDAAKENISGEGGVIERSLSRNAFLVLFGGCAFILLVFALRTAQLTLFEFKNYDALAKSNKTKTTLIFAPRGAIYDRNQVVLAKSDLSYDLAVVPAKLSRDQKKINEIADIIANILKQNSDAIIARLALFDMKSIQPEILFDNLTEAQALALEAELENQNGIDIERNYSRKYPLGEYLAQTLGYVGRINVSEKEKYPEYFLAEQVGKIGLEQEYEKYLHGVVGKKEAEIDYRGIRQKLEGIKDPVSGNQMSLTIDAGLQKQLFESLKNAVKGLGYKSERASGIIMNAKNGEVLAMASLPSFDSNLFISGISASQAKSILNDAEEPFLNRVISGQYPSGSIIKPVVAAAGLEEKVITPQTKIFDTGAIKVQSVYDPNIWYTFPDWKAHGLTDLYKAIAESCDVYFYAVGGGYDKIAGLGVEKLVKYFELFNFSQKTGIDLPGEKTGLVPTPEWKQSVKKEQWYLGDTYHMAIGQGDFLTTPIQMAVAIAAIGNGGKIVKPYLVSKIFDAQGNTISEDHPTLVRQLPISQKNLDEVKKAMRTTVVSGTIQGLKDLKVAVAAKSGSAQYSTKTDKTRTWFTGLAPVDDPEIVVVLLVEEGMMGRASVIPVARDVFNYYFSQK